MGPRIIEQSCFACDDLLRLISNGKLAKLWTHGGVWTDCNSICHIWLNKRAERRGRKQTLTLPQYQWNFQALPSRKCFLVWYDWWIFEQFGDVDLFLWVVGMKCTVLQTADMFISHSSWRASCKMWNGYQGWTLRAVRPVHPGRILVRAGTSLNSQMAGQVKFPTHLPSGRWAEKLVFSPACG